MDVSSSDTSSSTEQPPQPPNLTSTTDKVDHEGETEVDVPSSSPGDDRMQEADTTLGMDNSQTEPMNTDVTPGAAARKVKRYMTVHGEEGKANDVIYAPPLEKEFVSNGVESSTPDHDKDRVMVFFGGDMQDFPEAMETSEQREHSEWNLENTAVILQNQFPDRHVLVIRPCRMHDGTFSCFDNFLPTVHWGNPEHTPNHGALLHLRRLLFELSRRVNQDRLESHTAKKKRLSTSTTAVEPGGKVLPEKLSPVNFERGDISVVGFSKGCVVLNQFLYEFHYLKTLTPDDQSYEAFLSCLRDMYWLDGGHSGGKNTWIVSRSLLETLSRLKINIHVHVTPYQICDDRRPVLKREEKLFSESLKNSGASIQRYVHFETLPPSLTHHFQLLTEFGSPSTLNTFESEEWEGERGEGGKMLPESVNYHLDDLIPSTDYNDNEDEDEQS